MNTEYSPARQTSPQRSIVRRSFRRIHSKALLILAVTAAWSATTSPAATIVWGTPQNISGDSDVSTAGTLVQAANIGDGSVISTTINGVTFSAWNVSATTFGNFQLLGIIYGYNGYGYGNPPFSGLSSSYQALVGTGNYTNDNGLMTLRISNLTIGDTYQFQWWASDSRNIYPQLINATAGNTVQLDGNTTNAVGGIGQWVIGTFVADATTQDIDFQGEPSGGTMQNAYQLRNVTVPEPSISSLFLMGSAALLLTRRRQKAAVS